MNKYEFNGKAQVFGDAQVLSRIKPRVFGYAQVSQDAKVLSGRAKVFGDAQVLSGIKPRVFGYAQVKQETIQL